jgi:Ca-activated chloride channel family protein
LEGPPSGVRCFRLQPGEKLDRDFILRYHLGGDRVQSGLVVRPDEKGDEGTFLLTLVPPARSVTRQRPRDIVFVLDRSGSMAGWKMVAARRAVSRMVETLTDEDRFTIFAFDDRIETPPSFDGLALMPGSDRRRFQAAEFLAGVTDRGGTEMAEPLYKAVEELNRGGIDPGRGRILVLITDGQVGNEDQILRRIGERARGLRIFTLGIDQAVNAGFLRRLADHGGGASEVVESEARLDQVMDSVHRHIGTALLTGLELRAGGLDVVPDTLVPGRLPDLFAGSPVLIAGRYRGPERGAVVVHGLDAEGRPWSAEVQAWRDRKAPLAAIWARGRVRGLEDRYVIGGTDADRAKLEHEIVETSLRFGVLSRFTAFVAVDASEVVNEGGRRKQLVQPVEAPAGWGQYESPSMQTASGAGAGAARGLCSAAPASIGYSASDTDTDEADASPRFRSRFSRSAPARSADAQEESLVTRMLSAVFGSRGADRVTSAVIDRAQRRIRALDLLKRLRDGGPNDAAARRKALLAIHAELTALVKDLRQAGDGDATVTRLEELAAGIPQLSGDEGVVERHHRDIEAALVAWLQGAPAGPHEAFWK